MLILAEFLSVVPFQSVL